MNLHLLTHKKNLNLNMNLQNMYIVHTHHFIEISLHKQPDFLHDKLFQGWKRFLFYREINPFMLPPLWVPSCQGWHIFYHHGDISGAVHMNDVVNIGKQGWGDYIESISQELCTRSVLCCALLWFVVLWFGTDWFLYPKHNKVVGGVYWFHSVHLSVRPASRVHV